MAEQKAAPALKTHFVVARINWRVAGESGAFVRLPGETRVAAFADAPHAETDRAAREAEARKLVNPFRCGVVWSDRAHLPEPVFRDFIKDTGVEPPVLVPLPRVDEKGVPIARWERLRMEQERPVPPGAFRDWATWWDATAPALSAEQVVRVWEGLDRVRFFRAEERPVRAVAFAVVRIDWNYNDMWYYPGDDGGETTVAYRTRERAETECGRQNAEAREQWPRPRSCPVGRGDRPGPRLGVALPVRHAAPAVPRAQFAGAADRAAAPRSERCRTIVHGR